MAAGCPAVFTPASAEPTMTTLNQVYLEYDVARVSLSISLGRATIRGGERVADPTINRVVARYRLYDYAL